MIVALVLAAADRLALFRLTYSRALEMFYVKLPSRAASSFLDAGTSGRLRTIGRSFLRRFCRILSTSSASRTCPLLKSRNCSHSLQ